MNSSTGIPFSTWIFFEDRFGHLQSRLSLIRDLREGNLDCGERDQPHGRTGKYPGY